MKRIYFYTLVVTLTAMSRTYGQPPAGLTNEGNTCFMNGALQCMYNIADLTDFVIDKLPKAYFIKKRKGIPTLAYEYSNLVKQLRASAGGTVSPVAFCGQAWRAMQFPPYAQQDAHEFIVKLIDHLADRDVNIKFIKDWYGYPHNTIPKTFVARMFYAFLQSDFTRKDGSTGKEVTLESPLPVAIKKQDDPQPLKEVLDNFFAPELNVAPYTKKQYHLLYTPAQLVITLKRFEFGQLANKIQTPVTFPIENLDLSAYFISGIVSNYALYDLKGIVIHGGGTGGGHYTAYVSPSKGVWFFCNDSSVEKFDQIDDFSTKGYTDFKGNTPYILFYQRQTKAVEMPKFASISQAELIKQLEDRGLSKDLLEQALANYEQTRKAAKKHTTIEDIVNGINEGFTTIGTLAEFINEWRFKVDTVQKYIAGLERGLGTLARLL